jgi:hypothetical protein
MDRGHHHGPIPEFKTANPFQCDLEGWDVEVENISQIFIFFFHYKVYK